MSGVKLRRQHSVVIFVKNFQLTSLLAPSSAYGLELRLEEIDHPQLRLRFKFYIMMSLDSSCTAANNF
jgi:hypothetical protein